jgi:hypothetical protein
LALYLERQVKPRRADDATRVALVALSWLVDWRRLLTVVKPDTNAQCERLIGTIRRECLDWLIMFNEQHIRRVLQERIAHHNRGRPHTSLGLGIPEPR